MQEQYEAHYKKMAETPVEKLVVSLAIPTILSMLVTNIYNLVDTYFVGTLGNSESGAVGVVFALMAIIQAFGFTFGHGAGSNIARVLGAGDRSKANQFASTSFFLAIGFGTIFAILGIIFITPLMYLLGSTETILPHAIDYALWILVAAPAMMTSCVLNNILRYEGKASFAMVGLTSGGVLNIFLDALFIAVFNMGVSGAGLATCISQYISACILFYMFASGKTQSKLSWKLVSRELSIYGSILAIGSPSLSRQGLNSASTMILNNTIKVYGDPTIAAMGIVTKIVGFFFSVGLGLGQGFQPVSGFNYGAKKYSRVKKAFWFTFAFATIMMAVLAIFGIVGAEPLIYALRPDHEVAAIGKFALQAQCFCLIFLPFSVCGNMLFQSTGNSARALVLACMRSGLFFIPVLLVLHSIFGLDGVKVAQGVADVLSSLCTIPFVLYFFKKLPVDGEQNI